MRYSGSTLLWIMAFLLITAVVTALLWIPLSTAFMSNPIFNSLILAVLVIGILINLRQVLMLVPDAAWVRAYRASQASLRLPRASVITSLVRLLTENKAKNLRLSAMSTQALLDGIRSRLDESRELSRYIIGLLIFLGLLGTFWGLLDTLGAIGYVIRDLEISATDATVIFDELRLGLEAPLSGMGTAFSSSLFGLAGALVLGFVDLQTGHAQNRFYNDIEEWLSGLTHYSSGGLSTTDDGSTNIPFYIQALLEQTADSLDRLQRTLVRSEEERRAADQRIIALAEQVTSLSEQARSEQKSVLNLVRGQADLQSVLTRLADNLKTQDTHTSLEASIHQLQQLLNQMQGERSVIAGEIRGLAQVLRAQHDAKR